MAKQRIVQTKFWSDPFIQDLSVEDKLIYLYLITNERTSICGIYEITTKTISFDTGIPVDRVLQTVDRLCQIGKISRYDNWVMLKNFAKNQADNPSVKQGAERAIKELPEGIYDKLYTGCTQSGLLNLTKPKLNSNLNSKSQKEFSDEVKQLSDFLYECIKCNNEGFKGSPRKWDSDMDKLLRIDKRPYDEAAKLLQLVQEDDFWKANILSGKKFREKYDQLYMKMSSKVNNTAFIS